MKWVRTNETGCWLLDLIDAPSHQAQYEIVHFRNERKEKQLSKTLWISVTGSYQWAKTQTTPTPPPSPPPSPPPCTQTHTHTYIYTQTCPHMGAHAHTQSLIPRLLCVGWRLICTHMYTCTWMYMHNAHTLTHEHAPMSRTDNEGKITMKLQRTELLVEHFSTLWAHYVQL